MSRWRLTLVLLLALGGAALSGLLLLDHHGVELAEEAVSQLCGPPGESGCEQVARSRYSSMGGISLAAMGLFFYLSVLLLGALGLIAGPETRRAASSLILLSLGLAVVIDVVLLGLQAFSIGAFCSLCLWTYGINGAALVTLLPARTAVGELGHVLRQAELRMALAGWALGTVALGLSVGAAELAFGERDV
ncbi:MAG: vitamin K epoxide reductase family protein, partial [Acidobacteriota bacterium]